MLCGINLARLATGPDLHKGPILFNFLMPVQLQSSPEEREQILPGGGLCNSPPTAVQASLASQLETWIGFGPNGAQLAFTSVRVPDHFFCSL